MDPIKVHFSDIKAARERVSKILPDSPLSHSAVVSELVGHDVFFKWDNKFRTGSFKERGAINVLTLLANQPTKPGLIQGVCAASAGNHALALSYHAARLNIPCTIVMPVTAPLVKVQATQNTGAEVLLQGSNFDEAYEHALKLAQERGREFVSAFDDERVIAGQGTAGVEMCEQLADFDSVIVPVGGGGLISGIALAVKELRPETYILGIQSEWAIAAQKNKTTSAKPLIAPATIADGIAVKRTGKLNQPIIKKCVDSLATVSESDIARAIVLLLEAERTVVEGAGAAGLAGLLAKHLPQKCKRTVVMICGSNIDMNVLSRLLERNMGERGRLLKIEVSVPDRPGSLHATTGLLAKAGANVLQVLHDRSFSRIPGNVDITFELEVRNVAHREAIISSLKEAGIEVREQN